MKNRKTPGTIVRQLAVRFIFKMLSAQLHIEWSIFIQPTDITYDKHEIIIVQFPELLNGGLKQGWVLGRIIKKLTGRNFKVVADLQNSAMGGNDLPDEML